MNMKKRIITLVTMMMAAAVGAQAQSRLEPMTQIEQELWGEKEFGTWLSMASGKKGAEHQKRSLIIRKE